MNISYNDKTDLLYIRFDDRVQEALNRRLSEDIVLAIGEGDRIVGIEVIDDSKHLDLSKLFPVTYEAGKKPRVVCAGWAASPFL